MLILSIWFYIRVKHRNLVSPTPSPTPNHCIPPDALTVYFYPGSIPYDTTSPRSQIFFIVKVYCDVQYEYLSRVHFFVTTTQQQIIPLQMYYDGLKEGDYSGQIFGQDNDQYAHYYFAFPMTRVQISKVWGYPLNNVNYWSFLVGDRESLVLYKTISGDSELCEYSVNGEKVDNPFVSGGRTTNCYSFSPTDNSPVNYFPLANFTSIFNIIEARLKDEKRILPDFYHSQDGKIGVFRVDKETSMASFITEKVKTSCFDDYLFSSVQFRENLKILDNFSYDDFISYGILRVRVMDGFITTEDCGSWKKDFDVGYFSVTFHTTDKLLDPPLLPFWTANLRMLKEMADEQGYAYLFWAPYEEVFRRMKDVHQRTPPVVQWGHRKGYLFQTPTGRIIYRYKQVNPDWAGYPGNALCYPTYLDNKAITDELTDKTTGIDYCPSLYGQRFQNIEEFLNAPYIGAVPRDGEWPEHPSPSPPTLSPPSLSPLSAQKHLWETISLSYQN